MRAPRPDEFAGEPPRKQLRFEHPISILGPRAAAELLIQDYASDGRPMPGVVESLNLAGCQSSILANGVMLIRGSDQWSDWARYNLLAIPWPGDRYWWHKGFLNHAQRCFAFAKGKRVKQVVGHSLGAAAAGIVAQALGVPGYGFATPRVLLSSTCPPNSVVNFCRRDDLVCHVPLGCRHMGEVRWLEPGTHHWGMDHSLALYLDLLDEAA